MDQQIDIERGVLGSILSAGIDGDDAGRVMKIMSSRGVDEKWFHSPKWKRLWKAVSDEWTEHHTVDHMLVADRYGDRGLAAVNDAITAEVTSVNAEYYVEQLRNIHLYSLLHAACMETARDARPGSVSMDLDRLTTRLREIQGVAARADGALTRIDDHIDAIKDEVKLLSDERFVKKNRRFYIGLPMPWDFLNKLYMGLKPGLHIIAALPSQGKTTMGVAISLFWIQQGIKHGFVCIDMTAKELVKRYATLSKQVSLAKMNWGGSPEDVRLFCEGLDSVREKGGVEITESYMVERIRDEAYRGVFTHGWKAMVIDYLQLIQDDFKGKSATYEQVKQVTQAMKQLAKDLNIPIICLVQLARAFAKDNRDTNRKPGLDDLGDSAEIARAASTVAVLVGDQTVKKYWEFNQPFKLAFGDKYGNGTQTYLMKQLRPVWFYMIKNQQGPVGDIPFVMYPNYFMFRPGDPDAPDETVQIGGKDKKCSHAKFETLRDDWLHTEADRILEASGAMGHRGEKFN